MPKILDRLTRQLTGKVANPRAAATSQLQKHGILKKGTLELTPKGEVRNSMTAAERAKDRAANYSGKHKPSEYAYNAKTNMATLRRK